MERTLRRAVQHRIWLHDMQTQLENTSKTLRHDPSAAIHLFQQVLSRPSYFQAIPKSDVWRVLLGPAAKRRLAPPVTDVAVLPEVSIPRVFDFVALQPATPSSWFTRRIKRIGKAVVRFSLARLVAAHQWLMHPVVDTREIS